MFVNTYISALSLIEFRLFKKADLSLHHELCVFLGDNGMGKSSILDALALLISKIFPLCHYQPNLVSIPYRLANVRTWASEYRGKYRQERAEESGVNCALCHEHTGERETSQDGEKRYITSFSISAVWNARNLSGFETSTIRELAKIYNSLEEGGKGIPVFAYYGPHRGAQQGGRKRFGRRKIDYTNPFAAYINALHPSLDFEAFLDWFSEEESSELRQQRKDKHYISRELEAVRQALSRAFSTSELQLKDPRFETNPKRFVMTCVQPSGEELELEFDQLSDGYRGMIALVADFARRLAVANQYADGNPLDGAGILMIDEVDAHLHPKWQYRVIDDLRRTFPHVQLIVTTHSAEVVSTVDKDSIYIIEPEDGILVDKHPEQQTLGNYPEDIASMVMSAPNQVDKVPAYKAYLDCLAIIQQGDIRSPRFEQERQMVIDHYGKNHFFVQEINARLEGLQKREALLAKLNKANK